MLNCEVGTSGPNPPTTTENTAKKKNAVINYLRVCNEIKNDEQKKKRYIRVENSLGTKRQPLPVKKKVIVRQVFAFAFVPLWLPFA